MEDSNCDGENDTDFDDVPEDITEDEYAYLFMLSNSNNIFSYAQIKLKMWLISSKLKAERRYTYCDNQVKQLLLTSFGEDRGIGRGFNTA
ncbi:hypothetical protein TNCV_761811 [Trichonephila clavipes]|nr:hypothetical protein TNCV_761811 [Trichonephila clavipes]